jgi:hypothetical protein
MFSSFRRFGCVRMASTSAGSGNASRLFLGLDSSTQGLKLTVIDSKLDIVKAFAINYQKDLPHYKLNNGVHPKAGNAVTQPTLMVRRETGRGSEGHRKPSCLPDLLST